MRKTMEKAMKKAMKKTISVTLMAIMFVLALTLTAYAVFSADVALVAELESGTATSCVRDLSSTDTLYDIVQQSDFETEWNPPTLYGHFLCRINGEGGTAGGICPVNPDAVNDTTSWSIYVTINGTPEVMPVSADAPPNCWNHDIDSPSGQHYCATDRDVITFAKLLCVGVWPDITCSLVTEPSNVTFDDVCLAEEPLDHTGKLLISDLDIKVAGKTSSNLQDSDVISDEAEPGDSVKVTIELENRWDDNEPDEDIDIENIVVKATLKDIDDGDDVEDESDEFDLKPGKDEKITLELEVPLLVDEDDYDLVIEVEGDDDEGNEYDITWTLTLNVEKKSHRLIVSRARLSNPLVGCQDSVSMNLQVLNIGSSDEDNVRVEVSAPTLDFTFSEDLISLDADERGDSTYNKNLLIDIPDGLGTGTHLITVKAFHDSKLDDEEQVELAKELCIDSETPSLPDEADGGNVEVVVSPGAGLNLDPVALGFETAVADELVTEPDQRGSIITLILLNLVVLLILIGGLFFIYYKRR